MDSFGQVERLIGRRLEDCIESKPGKSTVTVPFESLNRNVNVWVPDYDLYREIALKTINQYRRKQTFSPQPHKLWPYVETYSALHLAMLVSQDQRADMARLDESYRKRTLVNGETVYGIAKDALMFSDGIQVLDPFLGLSADSVEKAWDAYGYEYETLPRFPPYTTIEQVFRVGTDRHKDFGLPSYQVLWAACLQEALEIKPLVDAELVRLIPGANFGVSSFLRFARQKESVRATGEAIRECLQSSGSPVGLEQLHSVLRSAQTVLDASEFNHAAPFFFSKKHLNHAQFLIRRGLSGSAQDSTLQMRSANLSTQLGIDAASLSYSDLITIRKNDETLAKWNNLRKDLSRICLSNSSDAEVNAAKIALSSEWKERVELERRKDGAISRRFKNDAFLYGTVGAVVGGGGAALTATALPLIAALAAGGALTGALPIGVDWIRSRSAKQMRDASRLAFERHLLAIERHQERSN